MYGTLPSSPVDHLDGFHHVDSAYNFISTLFADVAATRERIACAQAWQKKYYDRKHTLSSFGVGEQVLLSTTYLPMSGSQKFR